jgi:hypothetical protein
MAPLWAMLPAENGSRRKHRIATNSRRDCLGFMQSILKKEVRRI